MAYTSTVTTKITADTSGIKANIKALQQELKDMGEVNTIDDLNEKFKKIEEAAIPASAKLSEFNKLAKTVEFNGWTENEEIVNRLAGAIAGAKQQVNVMRDAVKAQQEQLKNGQDVDPYTALKDSVKKTADEIKRLEDREKELKKLQKEFLKEKVDQQSPQWRALQSEIKKTEDALKRAHGEETKFLKADFGPLTGSLDRLAGSMTGLGGQAGSLTGTLGKIGPMLSNPYTAAAAGAAALGVAFYEYNKALDETLQKTEQFTGLSGNDLMSLRNGIKAAADAWGKEYDEVLNGVDTLMSQFGMSGEEALDVISKGFTAGADDAGQMLSMMKKYGPAFHDMGIGAEELTALISQTKSGIFSEEGMDLIAQAGKRLREFNKNTSESLKAIGIDTQAMFSGLQNGTLRTIDAVKMVSARLKDVGVSSQEAGEVLKNVFGKQGAAGGMQLVTALSEVETSLDACVEGADNMHKATLELQNANRDLENAMATMFGAADGGFAEMTTKIKTKVIQAIADLINYMIDLYNESLFFRTCVHGIGFAFQSLWDVAKGVLRMIADGFRSCAKIIEGFLTFDNAKMQEGISELVSKTVDAFKVMGKEIADDFEAGIEKSLHGHIDPVVVPIKPENKGEDGVSGGGSGNVFGGSGSGGGKNKTEKIDYLVSVDDFTLETAKKKLQAWTEKKNKIDISDTESIAQCDAEIKKWTDEIQRREIMLGLKLPDGPLQKIDETIKKLEETRLRLDPEIDSAKIEEIKAELKRLGEEKINLEYMLGIKVMPGPLQKVRDEIKKLEDERLTLDPELDAETLAELNKKLDELVAKERKMKVDLGIDDKTNGKPTSVNVDLNSVKENYPELEKMAGLLKGLGYSQIQVEFTETGAVDIEKTMKNIQSMSDKAAGGIASLGSVFGTLGQAIGGAAGQMMQFTQTIIQGVAQIIPLITQMVAAKQTEAVASGIASASQTQPAWLIPVQIAMTVASILAAFASMPKFAEGGIVGGTSFHGDRVISALNSGEMVLNKSQQAKLFSLVSGANSNLNMSGGEVEFKIDGKVLKGVLSNTEKVSKRLK